MKITFEAPLGQRFLRRYVWAITTFTMNSDQPHLWWSDKKKKWISDTDESCSTHKPCKSYKAFFRHIRKHPELKGCEVILVSWIADNDIHVEV